MAPASASTRRVGGVVIDVIIMTDDVTAAIGLVVAAPGLDLVGDGLGLATVEDAVEPAGDQRRVSALATPRHEGGSADAQTGGKHRLAGIVRNRLG